MAKIVNSLNPEFIGHVIIITINTINIINIINIKGYGMQKLNGFI